MLIESTDFMIKWQSGGKALRSTEIDPKSIIGDGLSKLDHNNLILLKWYAIVTLYIPLHVLPVIL